MIDQRRFEIDPCARGEMIAKNLENVADGGDMIQELFRSATALGFDGDIEAVALAFEWITGARIYV